MLIVECKVGINTPRYNPISFKHVSLRCSLFDTHRTTYQSSHLRSIYGRGQSSQGARAAKAVQKFP